MNRRSLFLAAAALLPAGAVLAQTPSNRPTGVLNLFAGTGVGANGFVERATIFDNFGTQASQMLLTKSQHPQIRELASETIVGNARMKQELQTLPEATTRMPASLDTAATRQLEELRDQDGDWMNRWYVQMQVEMCRDTVQYFQAYAANGDVPALKSFAQRYLPVIQARQAKAEALQVVPRAG